MVAVTVIDTADSEIGSPRDVMRKRDGVTFSPVRTITLPSDFSIMNSDAALYSCLHPSGERSWLIELEMFMPPHCSHWKCWTVDVEPSDADAIMIMTRGDNVEVVAVAGAP